MATNNSVGTGGLQSTRCIHLNVGGQSFATTDDTLRAYPNTRLGRLVRDTTNVMSTQDVEFFFDRNPEMFHSLLDLYRTGELHFPKHLCGKTVAREMEFWEVPVELIAECCYKEFQNHQKDAAIVTEIDSFLCRPFDSAAEQKALSAWNRVWLIMERPGLCLASKIWNMVFFSVAILSVLVYSLETTMAFRHVYPAMSGWLVGYNLTVPEAPGQLNLLHKFAITAPEQWLRILQGATLCFFALEFVVRLLTCPRKTSFVRQVKNLFDLFLIVHGFIAILVEKIVLPRKKTFNKGEIGAIIFFYSLSVLRALRIMYLAKDFDAMKILLLSTRASLKVLALLGLCVASLATIFGVSIFLAELLTLRSTFPSIPYSLWYAIVTMTTVGYGDVVPESTVGRLLGCLCALCGVIIIALPITVIASNFSSYHDNLAARQQRIRTAAFLQEHNDFRRRRSGHDERSAVIVHEVDGAHRQGKWVKASHSLVV